MKHLIIATILLTGLTAPSAVAQADTDLGEACAEAAESGSIELPEGMSVEAAKSICACMAEEASEDVASEIIVSLETYELDARMGALSEEATAIFGTCASNA